MANLSSILDTIISDASSKNIFHTLNCCTLSNSFSNIPMLIIRNKDDLVNELEKYIDTTCNFYEIKKTDDNIKNIIIKLLEKANYEDFSNPINFIKNQTNYYLDETFANNEISKQQFGNITPYVFTDGNDIIEYGISNNICYIYSIGSEKSFKAFFNKLYKKNITKIKIVSYLPLKKYDGKNMIDKIKYMVDLFNNIIISSFPFEEDEYINLQIEGIVDFIDDSFDRIVYNNTGVCEKVI